MAAVARFIVLTLLAAQLEIVENAEVLVSSQAKMQAVKMVKIRQHSDLIRQDRGDDTPSTAASTEANSSTPAYQFANPDGCPSAGYRPLTAHECGNSTGEVIEGRNATYSTNTPCDAHCHDTTGVATGQGCNAAHWPQGCYMDKDDKTHYNPCHTRVRSGIAGRVNRNYTTDAHAFNAKKGICTDQAWPCVEGPGGECRTCLADPNARTHENHCTACNEDSGYQLIGSRCEATTTTTTYVHVGASEASVMNHSDLPDGFFCHSYAVHYEGVTACPVWQAAEACSLPPGMSNSLNGHHTIRAGQDLTLQECAMAALKAQVIRLHYKAAGQAMDGTQNFIFKYGRNSNRYMCEAQDSFANFTCTQEACCKVHTDANWGVTETPPVPILAGANYTYNYDPAQSDQWDLYVLTPLLYTDAAIRWP